MRRRRHSKTPPPPKPEPKPSWKEPVHKFNSVADIPDPVLKDLLKDLDKPHEETSPYFQMLTQPGQRLIAKDQELRVALVLATTSLEGGNCARAAKRLNMFPQTVRAIVSKHRERFPQTPEQILREQEHMKQLEEKNRKGVETLTDLVWDIAEKSAQKLLDRLDSEEAIPPNILNQIVKTASERALVLAGQPTSRTARVAERTMSDDQLEELRKQNEDLLKALKPQSPALRVVHGKD